MYISIVILIVGICMPPSAKCPFYRIISFICGENHRQTSSHWQTFSHKIASSTHPQGRELKTQFKIDMGLWRQFKQWLSSIQSLPTKRTISSLIVFVEYVQRLYNQGSRFNPASFCVCPKQGHGFPKSHFVVLCIQMLRWELIVRFVGNDWIDDNHCLNCLHKPITILNCVFNSRNYMYFPTPNLWLK
jgi:hypothetical protein